MNKKALSLAVLVAGAYPASSYALSLGDIESNSNLNQPLRAKIELLSASAQEARQLQVRLAPNSVFNRVGVDRPAFLDRLRFTSTVQNGKPVILITSDAPISEPFVNFLVEVSWPQGQLLKEYTVMLNPPVLMQPGTALAGNEATVRAEPRSTTGAVNRPVPQSAASPNQVAAAQAQQQQAQQQRARQQQQSQQQAQQQRARQQQQSQQQAQQQQRARQQQAQQGQARQQTAARGSSRTYRVRSGDTLFKIATRLRQPGVNVDQMMMALYRANPKAFIKGNINGLKAGAVLRAPSARAAKGASRAQARRQVRQQYAAWKKFRSTLAKRTVPQKSAVAKPTQNNTQQNNTRQTQNASTKAAGDKARLEVLGKADKGAANNQGGSAAGSERLSQLEQQLALARESMVARQRENQELKSRVNDLESMLRKKNRLIALRDDQLSQLQKQLTQTNGQASTPNNTAAAQLNQANNNGSNNGSGSSSNNGLNNGSNANNTNQQNQNVVPRTPGVTRPVGSDIQNQVANTTQADQNKVVRAQPQQNNAGQPATQQPKPDQTTANNTQNTQNTVDPDKPAAVFADQQSGENDLMDMLMSPMAWKIGAGALFSLLLLGLLSRLLGRRKSAPKKAAPSRVDDPVVFDADNESLGAMQEDQPFRELEAELNKAEGGDADPDDPFGTDGIDDEKDFTAVTPDIVEAEADQEEDEVLMEANVYIAYGLHQQAESELQKALEKHPERIEYRHKLLENYFASNNREAFDNNAEAFLATDGADRNSKMWQEIAGWGKKISPDNRLYTEQGSSGAVAVTAAGAAAAAASAIALGSDNDSTIVQPTDINEAADSTDDAAVNQILSGMQEDDDLGLDDFDFDLDDLESELGGESGDSGDLVSGVASGSVLSDTTENDQLADELIDEPGLDSGLEMAATVDDDFDFSLDDLAEELQQGTMPESDGLSFDAKDEPAAGIAGIPDMAEDETLDFDALLNGSSDASSEVADQQDESDGVGVLGGLAAGAAAAAGATAAVMGGKEETAEAAPEIATDSSGSATEDELPELSDINLEGELESAENTLDFDESLGDELESLDLSDNLTDDLAGENTDAELKDADIEVLDFDLDAVNPSPAEDLQDSVAEAGDAANEAADNVTNLNLHLDKESGLNKILPEDTFYTSDDASAQADNAAEGEDSWLGDIDDALSFLDMPDEEIDLHEAHISTKLDLARAYLDMGDIEGARSTLEEVMVEGNDNQRREAETLLHETG